MSENSCDKCTLGRWKMLIRYLEKHDIFAGMIISTMCIGFLITLWFCGPALKEIIVLLSQKALSYAATSISN